MRKDSLLQCMHEAAAQHRTPSISPISLQSKTKLGFNFVELLWYGRSWPQSQSERGKSNLEWKKNTFILSNYNELVDFLSSGMETPCLKSCTPERKQANWNVLVCTGTYQSVPVPASTRIPLLVQAGTRWYKAVPDFLVWNKTVPASTRFPRFVQDGTRRYQQVQDIVGLVQDSTSKYKISQIGTRQYKMIQGSTRIPKQVQDGMLHDSTSRYRNIIYSTYKYVPVCTSLYLYIPVCTSLYRCRLAQNLNSTLHSIKLHPPFDAYESQQIAWLGSLSRFASAWWSPPLSDHPGEAFHGQSSTAIWVKYTST